MLLSLEQRSKDGSERSASSPCRRGRFSRSPHRPASARSRISSPDRVKGIQIGGTVSFGRDESGQVDPSTPIFTTSGLSRNALAGAYAVVNTVSLYVEHGQETFHSVHVESAERVAAKAHGPEFERLVSHFRNRRRSRVSITVHPNAR